MAALPATRVVIGLDYGTTFTGVAFQGVVRTGNNTPITLVRDWPGALVLDKVPSDISYNPGMDGSSQWGGDFDEGSMRLIWTKLELDEQRRTEELDLILKALAGTNNLDFGAIQQSDGLISYPAKDSVEVIADYLEKVREFLWRDLLNTFGEVAMQTVAVDLVVTVPAMWSDAAKNRTFRAVSKAGFDELHFPGLRPVILISEPEATAVSIMKNIGENMGRVFGEQRILPGDCFVVCDAGGGTVDLVSYEVRQIEPFQIDQVTPGRGEKCGATFIDRKFQEWLERRLGTSNFLLLNQGSPIDSIGSHNIVNPVMSRIMRTFEEIKKRFAGVGRSGAEDFISLPPPLNNLQKPESGIADGEIRITDEDLKDMFQFSVTKVIELIRGQLGEVEIAGSRVRRVFLSGGFAASEYLRYEVEEFLRPRGIKLEGHPDTAWSEVVRGAVAWGVDPDAQRIISMRKCRRSYGVSVSEPFSSFKHKDEDSYTDQFDGMRKAKGQMIWLVKKGDAIMSDEPKAASTTLTRKFGPRDPRTFKTLLVSSDDDKTPQRLAEVPEATRTVTPITYDFSDIPDDQLMSVTRGSSYFVVLFEIKIQLQTIVDIRVTCNGREMRRLHLDYP